MTYDPANNASSNGPGGQRPDASTPRPAKSSKRLKRAGIVVAVLAFGAVGGAGIYHVFEKSHAQSILLLQPAPIAQIAGPGPVAVKGQVAEVFGNKFIIQDHSGRMLVDTGHHREGQNLVAKGEMITIQGDFDDGFIHASVMTRANGTTVALGSPRHHHHERGDDRPDPRADREPGRDSGLNTETPPANVPSQH